MDICQLLDDPTLDGIAMGEALEIHLAVFLVGFRILVWQESGLCGQAMAKGVEAGTALSFVGYGPRRAEGIGLIGCELCSAHHTARGYMSGAGRLRVVSRQAYENKSKKYFFVP